MTCTVKLSHPNSQQHNSNKTTNMTKRIETELTLRCISLVGFQGKIPSRSQVFSFSRDHARHIVPTSQIGARSTHKNLFRILGHSRSCHGWQGPVAQQSEFIGITISLSSSRRGGFIRWVGGRFQNVHVASAVVGNT